MIAESVMPRDDDSAHRIFIVAKYLIARRITVKKNICLMTGAVLAAMLALLPAQAKNYPNRRVRMIVPLAAGGGMDTVTRGLAQKFSETFGENFVVDNRPGAGSQIALEILAGSAADGHALMMISATTVVHPILYKSRFDIMRDFTPISQVTAQGYVLVVHPSIAAK